MSTVASHLNHQLSEHVIPEENEPNKSTEIEDLHSPNIQQKEQSNPQHLQIDQSLQSKHQSALQSKSKNQSLVQSNVKHQSLANKPSLTETKLDSISQQIQDKAQNSQIRRQELINLENDIKNSEPLGSKLKESLKKSYEKMIASSSKFKENQDGSRYNSKSKVYRLCAICGESLKSKQTVTLACTHKYHQECVEKKGKKVECPLCEAVNKKIETPAESKLKHNVSNKQSEVKGLKEDTISVNQ